MNLGLLLISGLQPEEKVTVSGLQLMAGGAAPVPHRVSDEEEVGQKPLDTRILFLRLCPGRHCTDRHSEVVASAR